MSKLNRAYFTNGKDLYHVLNGYKPSIRFSTEFKDMFVPHDIHRNILQQLVASNVKFDRDQNGNIRADRPFGCERSDMDKIPVINLEFPEINDGTGIVNITIPW